MKHWDDIGILVGCRIAYLVTYLSLYGILMDFGNIPYLKTGIYDLGLQGPPLVVMASFLPSFLPSLLASFPELGFRGGYHGGGCRAANLDRMKLLGEPWENDRGWW